MNPRIYKSKATKQAEYREAKKLGMTCAQYREALASGKITPPTTYEEALDTGEYVNRGWFGQKGGGVSRVKATHIASLKPDSKDYVTCCGKFLADVKVVTDIGDVTCGKCRTIRFVRKESMNISTVSKDLEGLFCFPISRLKHQEHYAKMCFNVLLVERVVLLKKLDFSRRSSIKHLSVGMVTVRKLSFRLCVDRLVGDNPQHEPDVRLKEFPKYP